MSYLITKLHGVEVELEASIYEGEVELKYVKSDEDIHDLLSDKDLEELKLKVIEKQYE